MCLSLLQLVKLKKDTTRINYLKNSDSQWMIAQMVERLLCIRQTRFQIPAPAPYEITL